MSVLTCIVLVGLLLLTVSELPRFGNPANKQYAADLLQYTDNEREKTKVTIEQLTEQIRLKKEASFFFYIACD